MTLTFVTFEYPLTKLLSPKDPPFCRNKNIDSFGLSSSKYSIEGGRSDLKENLPFPSGHPDPSGLVGGDWGCGRAFEKEKARVSDECWKGG